MTKSSSFFDRPRLPTAANIRRKTFRLTRIAGVSMLLSSWSACASVPSEAVFGVMGVAEEVCGSTAVPSVVCSPAELDRAAFGKGDDSSTGLGGKGIAGAAGLGGYVKALVDASVEAPITVQEQEVIWSRQRQQRRGIFCQSAVQRTAFLLRLFQRVIQPLYTCRLRPDTLLPSLLALAN